MQNSRLKIGIIRGLGPRLTQAEFACSFKRFEPTFIAGEANGEIKNFCNDSKLKTYDLKLKEIYGIDPVKLVLGKTTHQSWVAPSKYDLLNACKGLDVLETYELYHFFSGQAVDVAKKLNIPLVVEVWTSFLHPAYFVPPYSINSRKVINSASLFIARSALARQALIKLGVSESKIKVIYHGVNITRFQFKRKSKKSSKRIIVLYVGEMEEYKGVLDILKVWPQIYQKFPKAQLWLVGKGKLTESVGKAPGVKVFGYVSHSKLPEIYSQADIFVSPSKNRYLGPFLWWEEFFSYTLMEAQASGLPIVATNSGGIPEEVGGKNLIVSQGNLEELKNAFCKLIEFHDLRVKLGKNNRKRAERIFNLDKQTAKLEKEIIKLL